MCAFLADGDGLTEKQAKLEEMARQHQEEEGEKEVQEPQEQQSPFLGDERINTEEVQAIVIDNCSSLMKAGFAGKQKNSYIYMCIYLFSCVYIFITLYGKSKIIINE